MNWAHQHLRRLALACIVSALVSGCGAAPTPVSDKNVRTPGSSQQQAWPSPEALGACPAEWQQSVKEGTLDVMILPDWLYRHPVWIEVRGIAIGPTVRDKVGTDVTEIQITDATSIRGPKVDSAMVRPDIPQTMQTELARGATLLLGITEDNVAPLVVSLRPDGSAVFVGPCEFVHTNQLQDFAELRASQTGNAITPNETLLALVQEPDGELAKALYRWFDGEPPVPWVERSPDRRLLDPDETPPDILAKLYHIWIRTSVPEAWRNLTEHICTKTSLGWNGCIRLNMDSRGPWLEVTAFSVPGEDLEVWLLDKDANILTPLSFLGRIPADSIKAVAGNDDPAVYIEFTGGQGGVDLNALLSQIHEGRVNIQVTEPLP